MSALVALVLRLASVAAANEAVRSLAYWEHTAHMRAARAERCLVIVADELDP